MGLCVAEERGVLDISIGRRWPDVLFWSQMQVADWSNHVMH